MAHVRLNKAISNLCTRLSSLQFKGQTTKTQFSTYVNGSCSSNRISFSSFSSLNVLKSPQATKHIKGSSNGCLNLTSTSSEVNEYILPSCVRNDTDIILETPQINSIYDCPTNLNRLHEIIAPEIFKSEIVNPPLSEQNTPKNAAVILRIRRRKMNKHKLKKCRKRQIHKRRTDRMLKEKKKEMKFQEKLASVAQWAEDFNAEEFADNELKLARRGGFSVDVFKTQEARNKDNNVV